MRATILAPGSRGDVQPYVALGQALHALGYECTVVTTMDHEELVRTHGLEVATIPIDVAAELRGVEARRSVEGGEVVGSFRQFAAIAKRAAHALARIGLDAADGISRKPHHDDRGQYGSSYWNDQAGIVLVRAPSRVTVMASVARVDVWFRYPD